MPNGADDSRRARRLHRCDGDAHVRALGRSRVRQVPRELESFSAPMSTSAAASPSWPRSSLSWRPSGSARALRGVEVLDDVHADRLELRSFVRSDAGVSSSSRCPRKRPRASTLRHAQALRLAEHPRVLEHPRSGRTPRPRRRVGCSCGNCCRSRSTSSPVTFLVIRKLMKMTVAMATTKPARTHTELPLERKSAVLAGFAVGPHSVPFRPSRRPLRLSAHIRES